MQAMQQTTEQEPALVAVYDFDNTSIDCSSPLRLVTYLLKTAWLSLGTSLKIGFWGIAYKMRLPIDESWVRGQVFKAFEGRPKHRVDQFLANFYDEVIEPHFRPAADESMQRNLDEGHAVLVVSASFEPIVQRAMQIHGFTGQVSTRMKVAFNGNYTREVDGLPVEGEQKIVAIENWCNERYGEGNWKIIEAYGDHHSDEAMLACAEHPFAVNPNSKLEEIAKQRNWPILDWSIEGKQEPQKKLFGKLPVGEKNGEVVEPAEPGESTIVEELEDWGEVEHIAPADVAADEELAEVEEIEEPEAEAEELEESEVLEAESEESEEPEADEAESDETEEPEESVESEAEPDQNEEPVTEEPEGEEGEDSEEAGEVEKAEETEEPAIESDEGEDSEEVEAVESEKAEDEEAAAEELSAEEPGESDEPADEPDDAEGDDEDGEDDDVDDDDYVPHGKHALRP